MEEHGYPNECSQCSDPVKRMIWGCDTPFVDELSGETSIYEVGGKIYETCPLRHSKVPLVNEAISLFELLDKGILPETGAWNDQPAMYCAAMQQLQTLRRSVDAHLSEKVKDSK